jgi:hypothetical protein
MPLLRVLAAACFAALAASASAQVGARGMMAGAPRISRPVSSGVAAHGSLVGLGHPGFRHPNRFGSSYLGSPLWWDDGYGYGSPQVVVVQPDSAAAAPQPSMHWEDAPKAQPPLLIELQGDRYVRISGSNTSDASSSGIEPRTAIRAVASSATPLSHSAEESPTVFVFRDGHHEESSNYSIVAGTIYASADYWSNGAWSHKILIADLDLSATMQANEKRGVRFVLPSAPNEIVTRP